jgi:hypothetical protein
MIKTLFLGIILSLLSLLSWASPAKALYCVGHVTSCDSVYEDTTCGGINYPWGQLCYGDDDNCSSGTCDPAQWCDGPRECDSCIDNFAGSCNPASCSPGQVILLWATNCYWSSTPWVPPSGECYGTQTYGCGASDCEPSQRLQSQACTNSSGNLVTEYWCDTSPSPPCDCIQQDGIRVEDFYNSTWDNFPSGEYFPVSGWLKSITYRQSDINITNTYDCDYGEESCYRYVRFGSRLGNHTSAEDYVPYGHAYLNIPTAGDWTFYLYYDDGVKLYIDDAIIFENWTNNNSAYRSNQVTKTLTAGSHSFRLDYYHMNYLSRNDLRMRLMLEWSGPGQIKQVIPWQSFTTCQPDIPSCSASAPATPILTSPEDYTHLTTTDLSWNLLNWGAGCPANVNSFRLLVFNQALNYQHNVPVIGD